MPPKKVEPAKKNDAVKKGEANKKGSSAHVDDEDHRKTAQKKGAEADKGNNDKLKSAGKKGNDHPPEPSLKQSKNQRRAMNAAIEAERIRARDMMEEMTMDDDDMEAGVDGRVSGSVFSQMMKNATKVEGVSLCPLSIDILHPPLTPYDPFRILRHKKPSEGSDKPVTHLVSIQ
jgi:hypothetical protein